MQKKGQPGISGEKRVRGRPLLDPNISVDRDSAFHDGYRFIRWRRGIMVCLQSSNDFNRMRLSASKLAGTGKMICRR